MKKILMCFLSGIVFVSSGCTAYIDEPIYQNSPPVIYQKPKVIYEEPIVIYDEPTVIYEEPIF